MIHTDVVNNFIKMAKFCKTFIAFDKEKVLAREIWRLMSNYKLIFDDDSDDEIDTREGTVNSRTVVAETIMAIQSELIIYFR